MDFWRLGGGVVGVDFVRGVWVGRVAVVMGGVRSELYCIARREGHTWEYCMGCRVVCFQTEVMITDVVDSSLNTGIYPSNVC